MVLNRFLRSLLHPWLSILFVLTSKTKGLKMHFYEWKEEKNKCLFLLWSPIRLFYLMLRISSSSVETNRFSRTTHPCFEALDLSESSEKHTSVYSKCLYSHHRKEDSRFQFTLKINQLRSFRFTAFPGKSFRTRSPSSCFQIEPCFWVMHKHFLETQLCRLKG